MAHRGCSGADIERFDKHRQRRGWIQCAYTLCQLATIPDGVLHYQVSFEPSKNLNLPQYSFNGPIRYSRHFSPTAGAVTKLSNPNGSQSRLWSTWKIALKGVPVYFGDNHQHWNIHYKVSQQSRIQRLFIYLYTPPGCSNHISRRIIFHRTSSNPSRPSFAVRSEDQQYIRHHQRCRVVLVTLPRG